MSEADREQERRYLEDVAVNSIDLLLERLSPDARRLLWIATLANEPVTEDLIAVVWSGRSLEEEHVDQLRGLLAMVDQLPEELRQKLPQLSPEIRQQLAQTPVAPVVPPVGPRR